MFNVFLNTKVNDLSEEIKTYVLNMFDDCQLLTEEQSINDKFNIIIPDLIDLIMSALNDNSEVEKMYKTTHDDSYIQYSGYVYVSKIEKCIKTTDKNQTDYIPIYIKYDFRNDDSYYFAVEEKSKANNVIYIVVNFNQISYLHYISKNKNIDNYKSFEHFLYSKLKHELLHARAFYSNHTKDASLTKKYTVDISLSDYDIDADLINSNSLSELYSGFNKDYLYVQLNAMMYIFSPQEMNARNNETAGYIEKYIDLICADKEKYRTDYEMIFDSDENYHKILHKLVSDTNESHWLSYMEELKYFYNSYTHNLIQPNINVLQEHEDFCETLFIKSMLVIAYIFKSINRYYTHDNLNAIYINKLLITNELKEQDIKYFNNFIKYINKTIDEFKLKLLKTVHNRLNIAKKCLEKKHKPPFYIKQIHSNDLIEEYTI